MPQYITMMGIIRCKTTAAWGVRDSDRYLVGREWKKTPQLGLTTITTKGSPAGHLDAQEDMWSRPTTRRVLITCQYTFTPPLTYKPVSLKSLLPLSTHLPTTYPPPSTINLPSNLPPYVLSSDPPRQRLLSVEL